MSQVQTPRIKHYKKVMNTSNLKVMNAEEKEWDQLDTRLVKYGQNSE
jgi:hypothetical protein